MIQQRCNQAGALFILDEIQSGFGRTGHLFTHQKYGVIPDIMLIGKAMGGGMPIAGVASSKEIMNCLIKNPVLGHITTFGGHPVSCAAALATLETLLESNLINEVSEKEQFIRKKLSHPIIKEIRSSGLMMAVEIIKLKYLKHIVAYAIEHGVLVDWFLFNNRSFRLAPPLIATIEDLDRATDILLEAMDYAQGKYRK
jgi:acetylornithine/succinyldiaminopimelate/putrescine aminotransferase